MDIYTERLLIIPCTSENHIAFSESFKMGPHIEPYLDKLRNDSQMKGWGVWFVIRRDTNRIIGDVGFKGKPNNHNIVEIGYGIIPEAQNKGFGTEAVKGILDWAFSFGQVDKVIAECLVENKASIKVLEKLGMERIDSKDGMLYWELTQ